MGDQVSGFRDQEYSKKWLVIGCRLYGFRVQGSKNMF